ncbi:hypothetical protein SLEP1_g14823 [Rubroshorea leprosula]|uniref:DYW domain-containing protein n=1 Tax=Rubroshorea leprosula TaxID=152421 RepID=A0AAV5IUE2_9ROSI|nr:hypothetical protein SLEP1_g14823 [Rubroshorea leprosula]
MVWGCLRTRCSSSIHYLKQVRFLSVALSPHLEFYPYKSHAYHYSSCANDCSTDEIDLHTLHAKVIKVGSLQNLDMGNHILNLYVKSQNLGHAQKVFDDMLNRDVRTWTILISGFARVSSGGTVLKLFREMQNEGVCPNQFTLSSVLKSCSSLNELNLGKEVHGWIVVNGIVFDSVLGNSLLDLYVKCEDFGYANKLFESMRERDTVSWNILIGGSLHIGDVDKAIELFRSLPFKDVATWNTVIDGLMQDGFERTALELLYEMVKNGPLFNRFTFTIALALVSSLSILELGKQIHGRVLRFRIHVTGLIQTCLINMYCKSGKLDKASIPFRETVACDRKENSEAFCLQPLTDIVSWSTMVSGFVQNGEYEDALKTFTYMVHEQVEVDLFTVTSIICACANSGAFELGRQVHALIEKSGHRIDAHLGSSLIDMYVKCGNLEDAWMIFKQTNDGNIVLWTSMISGCAMHGQGRKAVWLFECMISEGITPNEVTFVTVLTACSHAGLLEEGSRYFRLMKEVYGIHPGVEHFTCMVDLYGRAGRLKQAKNFIHENGLSQMSAVWRSFLASCWLHKNIEMARWVSEKLLHLNSLDAGSYVLLSNIYAIEHRWDEAAHVRSLMQQRGVKKHPAQSWIQIKNQVHAFIMGDRSHPQDAEIYTYLDKLIGRLKEVGYSSDVHLVMQDVEGEQGEMLLGVHSEKLAIAYGIISTSSRTPIRIMKNLRVCNDCHNFIKYTSLLLDREIIVRDTHRFHHFKYGHCSCGDYW